MTLTPSTFEVDLRDSPQPLAVKLDAAPLERLLADAEDGYRLYELALVQRPGDLWEYLEVVPLHVPAPLAARLDLARTTARKAGETWPDQCIPFGAFDREVRGEKGEASEAWAEACAGDDARAFVQELFERLPPRGTGAGPHPFSCLAREHAIAASRRHPPNAPAHTEGFYAKVAELILEPDVDSVSVRGLGDHRLLRMLCDRQREREDFEISATTEREANNLEWGAHVAYYFEDIGQGFLFVQDGASSGRSVKDLVETYTKLGPGGLILSSRDEGDITGFARESGDGWYLYRSYVTPRMLPTLRRYHNLLALMLAQENGELSDTQVVEIIAQWENFVSPVPAEAQ